MKLRAKIFLLLIPLIVLPLLTLGWIAFERLTTLARTATFQQMDTLLGQMTLHVRSDLETVHANMALFAHSEVLKRYLFADEEDRYSLWQRPLLELFANYIKAYPDYYEIRVLLPDGYEDSRITLEEIPNVREEEGESVFFQTMRASKSAASIFLHRNPDNQETSFLATQKLILRDPAVSELEATLRGYLALTIRPSFIIQQTQVGRIGQRGWIFVTDHQGTVLFHPDAQRVQRAVPHGLFQRLLKTADTPAFLHEQHMGNMVYFQGKQLHEQMFLFGVLPEEEILEESRALGLIVAGVILVSILVTGALFFVLLNSLLVRPIRALDKATKKIAKGDLEVHLDIKSRDEVGSLATEFNKMAVDLKMSRDALENINRASRRFVPLEFLQLLKKENIVDVQLGNHHEMSMTVLFSDIRSFTTLSESMTPKENFLFLNSYLEIMGPVIREYGGFIDKYIGDAIMALFPKGAGDAVAGAIGMLRQLAVYNAGRKKAGYVGIDIGIGLNTGNLMLGTIGEDFRMEGTVISDAVNLAARIEGMTKRYGAPIVISDQTFALLPQPCPYPIRMLDRVVVVGKSEPVTLYEVLEGDASCEMLKRKRETRSAFEEAVALYGQQAFAASLAIMETIYAQNPKDKAANMYIHRCKRLLKEGVDGHWTGVATLGSK